MPFEREEKYLVLKWSDIKEHLTKTEQRKLSFLTETIYLGRDLDGKITNTYVVVNEDELYAEEVWGLIQKHWEVEDAKKKKA